MKFTTIISSTILNIIYKLYKFGVSPLLGNNCRFNPSCSDYAYQAIGRYGWIKGGWMAVKRLLRCHPFSRHFGSDPVPECKVKK